MWNKVVVAFEMLSQNLYTGLNKTIINIRLDNGLLGMNSGQSYFKAGELLYCYTKSSDYVLKMALCFL
jgi:hypothetical protein